MANNSTVICDECLEDINTTEIDNASGAWCTNCASRCDDCGSGQLRTDLNGLANGEALCQACFADSACTCENCHDVVRIDDSQFSNDTTYCSDCAERLLFTCDGCADACLTADAHESVRGMHCESCHDELERCACCSEILGYYNRNDDRCDGCEVSDDDWQDELDSYGTRAERHGFYDVDSVDSSAAPNKLYLGIEIELELERGADGNVALRRLRRAFDGLAVIKSDSSLDNGLEIATAPMTYDYHMSSMDWENKMQTIRNASLEARSSCGIHIHASRAALTDGQLMRLSTFIFRKSHQSVLEIIARRSNNSYSCFAQFSETPEEVLRRQERYKALNFSPVNTIEFRLFASTTDENDLITALEFVKAAIDFTAPTNLPLSDCTLDEFSKFVTVNDFENLQSVLSEAMRETATERMRLETEQRDREARLESERIANLERERIEQERREEITRAENLGYTFGTCCVDCDNETLERFRNNAPLNQGEIELLDARTERLGRQLAQTQRNILSNLNSHARTIADGYVHRMSGYMESLQVDFLRLQSELTQVSEARARVEAYRQIAIDRQTRIRDAAYTIRDAMQEAIFALNASSHSTNATSLSGVNSMIDYLATIAEKINAAISAAREINEWNTVEAFQRIGFILDERVSALRSARETLHETREAASYDMFPHAF